MDLRILTDSMIADPLGDIFATWAVGAAVAVAPRMLFFANSGLGHPTLGGDASHLHAVLVAIPGAPWYPIIPSFRHHESLSFSLQHLQQH